MAIFVAGIALFMTTACNNGDLRGARPDNPPVQMGGRNNPHMVGGDGYTNYKMSPDPSVAGPKATGDRADLGLSMDSLIATHDIKSDASRMLYPGDRETATSNPDIGARDQQRFIEDTQRIPAQPQPILDRSDPDAKILEKIGQAFEDASEFIKDGAESATE